MRRTLARGSLPFGCGRRGDGRAMEQRGNAVHRGVGGLQGQGSTSDAVQHVVGLATAVDEDDRHFRRAGCRSLTGLVEFGHCSI